MTGRPLLALLTLALFINVAGFGLIGYLSSLALSEPVPAPAVATNLSTVFGLPPSDVGEWSHLEGWVHHGALVRRGWAFGVRDGVEYREQVLKAGWPFTSVRGFLHVRNGELESRYAAWMAGPPSAGPVRYWPLQPVWPGLVFNTAWIALVLWLLSRWLRGA